MVQGEWVRLPLAGVRVCAVIMEYRPHSQMLVVHFNYGRGYKISEWSHGLYNNIAHRWRSVSSLLPSIMSDAHRAVQAHLDLTWPSSSPKIRVLFSLYPTSAAYPVRIYISSTTAKQRKDRWHTICTRPRSAPAISAALMIAATFSGFLVR